MNFEISMNDPLRSRGGRATAQGTLGRFSARDSARTQQGDYLPVLPSSTARSAFNERAVSRRLIITATPKGGVGKSFFLINLADWLAEKNVSAQTFDMDAFSGTLTRFQPETQFLAPSDESGFREILASFEEVDLALVDGSAAAIPDLGRVNTIAMPPRSGRN